MSSDAPVEETGEQEKPARRKKRRAKGWVIALSILGLIIVTLAAIVLYYLNAVKSAVDSIPRQTGLLPSVSAGRPPTAENSTAINALLLGSDARSDDEKGRSDTIIWVHIPADRKDVHVVSFTRDLWVDIPGHGKGKINWAYAFGGVPLQVQTVENLIGARVDHVGLIDFKGFIKLTESLGGVSVYNKYASGSQGYTFPEGQITVSGSQALTYVRERENLPEGAWSRAERQRDVIGAIVEKMLSPEVLANPSRFNAVVTDAAKAVVVDEGVTNEYIYTEALSMKLSGRSSIHSLQAPVTGQGRVGDQAVDFADLGRMKELGDAFREDRMADYLNKYVK